jgi:hypothetical protein
MRVTEPVITGRKLELISSGRVEVGDTWQKRGQISRVDNAINLIIPRTGQTMMPFLVNALK